jgi:hypothetical protein
MYLGSGILNHEELITRGPFPVPLITYDDPAPCLSHHITDCPDAHPDSYATPIT